MLLFVVVGLVGSALVVMSYNRRIATLLGMVYSGFDHGQIFLLVCLCCWCIVSYAIGLVCLLGL